MVDANTVLRCSQDLDVLLGEDHSNLEHQMEEGRGQPGLEDDEDDPSSGDEHEEEDVV